MKIFFLYSCSVYSCHLFLISSASIRSMPFFFFWMKCSLGFSNFFEEISSLYHSIIFLYCFALITDKGFLISPWYSLELCIQIVLSLLFSLVFTSLLFTLFVRPPQISFAFLHFSVLGMMAITASCTTSQTFVHSSSSTLSDLIPWIYLSPPLYNRKGFDLGHSLMF